MNNRLIRTDRQLPVREVLHSAGVRSFGELTQMAGCTNLARHEFKAIPYI